MVSGRFVGRAMSGRDGELRLTSKFIKLPSSFRAPFSLREQNVDEGIVEEKGRHDEKNITLRPIHGKGNATVLKSRSLSPARRPPSRGLFQGIHAEM